MLNKLLLQRKQLNHFLVSDPSHSIYAHRIVAHFVKCFDFIPYFWNEKDGIKKSDDYKIFSFKVLSEAFITNALINSTTFYYFYLLYSDAYHCGRELIISFPHDFTSMDPKIMKKVIELNEKLMEVSKANSKRRKIQYRTGWIEYDEFYPRLSKPIIDQIDTILAQHYGFTQEELDFIINYDIKYRMGKELDAYINGTLSTAPSENEDEDSE
jgi:hypothetical protein